jgi:hypothetical protein
MLSQDTTEPLAHLTFNADYTQKPRFTNNPEALQLMKGLRKCGTYIQWSIYSAIRNEIMLFAGKWMELEIIILSEVNQARKDKGQVFPHMWELDLKDKCRHIYDLIYMCVSVYV